MKRLMPLLMLGTLTLTACGNSSMKTLQRYVIVQPGQVQNLRVKGSDFQETHLVMQFESRGAVNFPSGPSLRAATPAKALEFARNSECVSDLKPNSDVRYETIPQASARVARLIVSHTQSTLVTYCVIVFNTDL